MKPGGGIAIVGGSNGRIGDAVMRWFARHFEDFVVCNREAP